MDLFALAHALSHAVSAIPLDDNSVSVLAMLGGMAGGWTLTTLFRPKPKKIETKRNEDSGPRKPQ